MPESPGGKSPRDVVWSSSGSSTRVRVRPRVRWKVLLLDDEPSSAAELRDALGELQCDVTLIADNDALQGGRVLSRIAAEHFDVVLISVRAPELSGLGTFDRIRRDPRGEAVPVVLIGTALRVLADHEGSRTPAEGYVRRPPDRRGLVAELEARLGAVVSPDRRSDEASDDGGIDVDVATDDGGGDESAPRLRGTTDPLAHLEAELALAAEQFAVANQLHHAELDQQRAAHKEALAKLEGEVAVNQAVAAASRAVRDELEATLAARDREHALEVEQLSVGLSFERARRASLESFREVDVSALAALRADLDATNSRLEAAEAAHAAELRDSVDRERAAARVAVGERLETLASRAAELEGKLEKQALRVRSLDDQLTLSADAQAALGIERDRLSRELEALRVDHESALWVATVDADQKLAEERAKGAAEVAAAEERMRAELESAARRLAEESARARSVEEGFRAGAVERARLVAEREAWQQDRQRERQELEAARKEREAERAELEAALARAAVAPLAQLRRAEEALAEARARGASATVDPANAGALAEAAEGRRAAEASLAEALEGRRAAEASLAEAMEGRRAAESAHADLRVARAAELAELDTSVARMLEQERVAANARIAETRAAAVQAVAMGVASAQRAGRKELEGLTEALRRSHAEELEAERARVTDAIRVRGAELLAELEVVRAAEGRALARAAALEGELGAAQERIREEQRQAKEALDARDAAEERAREAAAEEAKKQLGEAEATLASERARALSAAAAVETGFAVERRQLAERHEETVAHLAERTRTLEEEVAAARADQGALAAERARRELEIEAREREHEAARTELAVQVAARLREAEAAFEAERRDRESAVASVEARFDVERRELLQAQEDAAAEARRLAEELQGARDAHGERARELAGLTEELEGQRRAHDAAVTAAAAAEERIVAERTRAAAALEETTARLESERRRAAVAEERAAEQASAAEEKLRAADAVVAEQTQLRQEIEARHLAH